MNSTIRNWLGVTLIIALLLLVFKKPFSYPEMQHAFMAPYYVDFWILDLQEYWPFEKDLGDKVRNLKYGNSDERNQSFASLIEATTFISAIIWFVLHVAGLIFTGIGIYFAFFKKWTHENKRR